MTKFLPSTKCYWFILVLLFSFSFHAQAQRYDLVATSGTFTPLVGGTAVTSIQTDDALSSTITFPLGITFNYFGTDYTQFKASSNGFISFDVASTSSLSSNQIEGFNSKIIAPLWDDLDGLGGAASYQVSGSAPNRVFTFEWLSWKWRFTAASSGISFQVNLYESTHTTSPNKIEFVYRQEAGALDSPSASIGLIGNVSGRFYSLTNSTSSPTTNSLSGVNSIATKPASGQIYSFTPNSTPFTIPSTQATNITTPALGSVSADLNWTNGNGQYRTVFMKQTSSTSEVVTLTDGAFYTASPSFGNGSIGSTGWYCVYNGVGTSVSVINLQSGLPYRIHVVEYNGAAGTQKYNSSASTNNPINATTMLVPPSAPISTLTILNRTSTQATFDLNQGNGAKRAIFVKASSSGISAPVDNTTYTANTVFGLGTQIGTTGWYCIFNGTSSFNSITTTGLSANTSYSIHVVDYNGLAGFEKYFSSTDIDNPVLFTTYISAGVPNFTFVATAGNFTPVVSGTPVDSIEGDDALSVSLPIGFTFYHGGLPFTDFKASSNGFLTFNNFQTSSESSNDLALGLARPVIAPLWDDLSGVGGQASYIVTGLSPNRVFTFEWLNWKWNYNASSSGISFQAKLYEADNKIEYIYRQEAGVLNNPTASIGMAFAATGFSGTLISLTNATTTPTFSLSQAISSIATKPATGQIYSFTPKKDQTITFTALASKSVGDASFSLTASSSSNLPVSYSSSNTAVATVTGSTVTIVGGGTTTITASQAGDANFNAAVSVPQSLIVNKLNQTISFAAITDKTLGDAAFSFTANATSSLPVAFSTSPVSDKISISASQVTLLKAGSVTVNADQAGNSNYNAAPTAMRTFCINPAKPTISITGLNTETPVLTSNSSTGNQWYKDGAVIVSATNATYTVTQPGSYTVVVKVDNCSSVPSNAEAIIITGDTNKNISISVYPNPVETDLMITLPVNQSAIVSIVDMLGRPVGKKAGVESISMDVRGLSSGNYIVFVQTEIGLTTKKINKK
jgi:Secretion system C-terminal sorting domain